MRIETVGSVANTKVNTVIKNVVAEVMEKAKLPEGTKFRVRDFSCNIGLMMDGVEQALTVTHDGITEMLVVKVALDEKGNITKSVNNTKESFLDEYTRASLKGEQIDYSNAETIVSEYDEKDLELLSTLAVDDKAELVYKHLPSNVYVLRYFVGNRLIGELTTKQIPEDHLKNMME